jgi:hypothetical protein
MKDDGNNYLYVQDVELETHIDQVYSLHWKSAKRFVVADCPSSCSSALTS